MIFSYKTNWNDTASVTSFFSLLVETQRCCVSPVVILICYPLTTEFLFFSQIPYWLKWESIWTHFTCSPHNCGLVSTGKSYDSKLSLSTLTDRSVSSAIGFKVEAPRFAGVQAQADEKHSHACSTHKKDVLLPIKKTSNTCLCAPHRTAMFSEKNNNAEALEEEISSWRCKHNVQLLDWAVTKSHWPRMWGGPFH